tara:strand:+ start:12799 stop:13095 length:297 start_codon:yes stop_codon:yes gene_type:complete
VHFADAIVRPMKMKSLSLLVGALLFGLAYCGGGSGSGGDPKVGDSCEGISAVEARIACSENNIIFCSSYTDYEYKLQNECGEGRTCEVAEDGKSATCK